MSHDVTICFSSLKLGLNIEFQGRPTCQCVLIFSRLEPTMHSGRISLNKRFCVCVYSCNFLSHLLSLGLSLFVFLVC